MNVTKEIPNEYLPTQEHTFHNVKSILKHSEIDLNLVDCPGKEICTFRTNELYPGADVFIIGKFVLLNFIHTFLKSHDFLHMAFSTV